MCGLLYADDAGIVCIAIIKRAREDDDGDRDCVLAVRDYGFRGENRDFVPANHRRSEGVVHINAVGVVYKKTSSLCTWSGLSPQTETLALK